MDQYLRKWLSISFFNLMLVALLGVIMRYKIAFYLPFVQQKFVLHSHSHFAFSGWITQTLMVLLVHYVALKNGEQVFKKYRWLLYANLITAYGMLIGFFIQGYAFFSISFSTLSIFVSYFFAFNYWIDLNRLYEKKISHLWFKAALVCSIISSVGAFTLSYMMANKITHQNWYLSSIYFFLHFQYNGWFLFAGIGLFVSRLENIITTNTYLKIAFLLFSFACIPAYFLSVLWIPLPFIGYCLIVAAVLAQLVGWTLIVSIIYKNLSFISIGFLKSGRVILLFSAIAFSIKLLLQSGSVHPALSQLSYGFRPIIIGYLHLVLLAVTSLFLMGYIVSFQLVKITKSFKTGMFIFVAGIIINELLLMVQGVAALSYTIIPNINIFLLIAAIVLLAGICFIFTSNVKLAKPGR